MLVENLFFIFQWVLRFWTGTNYMESMIIKKEIDYEAFKINTDNE
jgi:hypothetical protein